MSTTSSRDLWPGAPPRRVVITGAAGFIGSHLANAVAASSDAAIVGVDNGRSGDWSRVSVPCERIERDLAALDEAELENLCDGADVVFHLAAEKYNSSKSTPQKVIDVNISATARLFRAAAAAGVPKVVFTSSLYAYGSMGPAPMSEGDLPAPTTDYGMSKVAGEHLLRATARARPLGWSVARLFFVYGPRQHAEGGYKSVILSNFERILRGERPTIYGDGDQALDYVFVDDVIDALVRLTDRRHDGGTYNIGSGVALTVKELTAVMRKVSGTDLLPEHVAPDWTAGSRRCSDPSSAAEELGWTASVGIEEGLRQVWKWMSTAT